MNPSEIRSDLVGAWLMRQWMLANAPHLVEGWTLNISDVERMFAERVGGILPDLNRVFATQAPIAATAIQRWNLTDVVLLSGGTPSPFSPKPDQILYFTDANPAVVAEAARAGYRAERIDIRNPDDFKKVPDARTAISTGLLHFLPDEPARATFKMLASTGLTTFVFNHMRAPGEGEMAWNDTTAEYSKLGFNLFPRTKAQVVELVKGIWTVEDTLTYPDFYRGHPDFGHLFNLDSDTYSYIFLTRLVK